MAYREVEMWEILDVLRRVHRGETRAAIQRATGRTRKTVRRYLERARRLGWCVPYSSLHRFAIKRCSFHERQRITVRVADVEPGELAEVDFGRLGLVPDPETGRRCVLHALIVTLVYSRHQYIHVTTTQKI